VADINLTQEDADALLAMEKHKVDDTPYEYPRRCELHSADIACVFSALVQRAGG